MRLQIAQIGEEVLQEPANELSREEIISAKTRSQESANASAVFVGQGSLSQPLSDFDLMRERVSNNIGETGDEEVSRLAVNRQIVVTVSAGAPIYVVLEQTPKSNQPLAPTSPRNSPTSNSSNVDQLRQLQQELNQSRPAAKRRSSRTSLRVIASNPTVTNSSHPICLKARLRECRTVAEF